MKNWKDNSIWWIDFGPEVKSIKDVKLGCQATILPGGDLPNGDFTMPNGEIWSFINGELVSMEGEVKQGEF